jgi:hypothetical protein
MAVCLLTSMVRPADAGFLDSLFGGFLRQRAPEPRALPDMTPIPNTRVAPQGGDGEFRPRAESGPRSAYCVRTCDGHYFPVQARAGMSAAQACSAFCPATQTKLYAGGGIDYAVAQDGSHYRDLPKAFAYRKQLVDGCSCNGKDAFGLAHLDVKEDPTLVRGDIVVTEKGMMSVTGRDANGLQGVAVNTDRTVPARQRDQVAETRSSRPSRTSRAPREEPAETTGAAPAED